MTVLTLIPYRVRQPFLVIAILLFTVLSAAAAVRPTVLEEVIVTAQKREESLQSAPIAISVLQAEQLEVRGVTSLDALNTGLVPSLHSHGYANTNSTLV